jgi:hypothetical protein
MGTGLPNVTTQATGTTKQRSERWQLLKSIQVKPLDISVERRMKTFPLHRWLGDIPCLAIARVPPGTRNLSFTTPPRADADPQPLVGG